MRSHSNHRAQATRFAAMTSQILGMTLMDGSPSAAQDQPAAAPAAARADDNGGITLPPGFCATVVADNVGHARHLVVAPNGVVYVNTWSRNDTPPPGGFLVALQDHDGDGQADTTVRFGGTLAQGAHGGTGIALYDGSLHAEANDRIVRYELPDDAIAPTGSPKTIVSGLPLTGDHPMHPFAIDARGGLYVNSGSATNACQVENRMPQSPGHRPCTELATRAGIWRYDANRTGQRFSATERFATGIPNAGGSAVDRHMGNIGKDDLAVRGRAYSHVQPRCHAHGHAGGPKSVTLRPYGAGTGLEARDRATTSLADRNPSKYGGPTARDSSVRQPPEAEEKAIK